MKTKNKFFVFSIIGIIVLLGITVFYKNRSSSIISNTYLSSKEDGKRSVYSKKNEKNIENGKRFEFEKFTGKWSLIEFSSKKDTKISITNNTKIEKGIFYTVVLDSEYNILAKQDEDSCNKNINFTIPKDGKYIIRIVGKKASGRFDIKIKSSNDINITYKDFFD